MGLELVLWLLPLLRGEVIIGNVFGRLDLLSTRRGNRVGLVGLGRGEAEAADVVLVVADPVGVVLIRFVGDDDLGRRVVDDTANGRSSCFLVLFVGDDDLERVVVVDGD